MKFGNTPVRVHPPHGSLIAVMTPDQADEVSQLVGASINGALPGFYSPEVIEALINANSAEALLKHAPKQVDYVLRKGDYIAGMIGLKRNEIGHLFVHPAQYMQGIGHELVAFARSTFEDAGYTEMVVLASLNSTGFYKRCGFVEQARGSFVVGDNADLEYVKMTSKIKNGE